MRIINWGIDSDRLKHKLFRKICDHASFPQFYVKCRIYIFNFLLESSVYKVQAVNRNGVAVIASCHYLLAVAQTYAVFCSHRKWTGDWCYFGRVYKCVRTIEKSILVVCAERQMGCRSAFTYVRILVKTRPCNIITEGSNRLRQR